jgi:taurine dioxygenase
MLDIQPTEEACGATIKGVDLSAPLNKQTVEAIRSAWIEHKVIVFPEQNLTDEDLVRITNDLGSVGDDPYFVSISENTPVVALTRRADEKAPVFAEV